MPSSELAKAIGRIKAGSIVQFGGMVNDVCFLKVGELPSENDDWSDDGYDLCNLSGDFHGPRAIQVRGLAWFMSEALKAGAGLYLGSEEMYDGEGKLLQGIELAMFRDVDELRYVVRAILPKTELKTFADVPERRRFLLILTDNGPGGEPKEKEVECVKIQNHAHGGYLGVRLDEEGFGKVVFLRNDHPVKLIID